MRNVPRVAQLNVPVVPGGVKGAGDVVERLREARKPGGRARVSRAGHPAYRGVYLSQASTLSRLASTHFFAAASGAILSTAMYLATVFWSSFVQLNFFTRS